MIIPDKDYERMIVSNKRQRGSFLLVTPMLAECHLFCESERHRAGARFVKLPHGKASLNPQEQKARVTMLFDLRETDLSASKQVKVEADVASKFLEDNGAK